MDKSGLNLITDPYYITSVPYPKLIVGCEDLRANMYLIPQDGPKREGIRPSLRFQDHKTGLFCSMFDLESVPDGVYLAMSSYKHNDQTLERSVIVAVKDGEVKTVIQAKKQGEKDAGSQGSYARVE